jgi:hypothetical protein
MSYIRYNHDLNWFDDQSTEYVYECGDGQIEDYNSSYMHNPSLVELIGTMVYDQTEDFDYATKIVVTLARKLGIANKLRKDNYPHEEFEKRAGRDYKAALKRYTSPARGYDDLYDFWNFETFKEEELLDVEKYLNEVMRTPSTKQ